MKSISNKKEILSGVSKNGLFALALLGLLAGGVTLYGFTHIVGRAIADDDAAAPPQYQRPALFEELLKCRAVADDGKRLACYDTQVAALASAADKEEIILTDRESVKEAKRGLFGFSLPKLKIFGSRDDDDVTEIAATIRSARYSRDGGWIISLEGGGTWQQIDTKNLPLEPRTGMEVRIRKGALGSYLVNIGKMRAIKMKRID